MQRMHYTPTAKVEALALLAEFGKAEAARRTGIPVGTIASWGARTGVQHVVRSPSTVAESKQELVIRLLPLARRLVDRLEARIEADDASLKDLAQTLMIVVDRVQLLTGAATARTESAITTQAEVVEAKERAVEVLDELAGRRSA